MAMKDALQAAMRSDNTDAAMQTLLERGIWMADEDTMTMAIHTVYCGMMADHDHPNEKDRDQARRLVAAIGESLASGPATS
jgi:hypothetical protein